MSQAKKATQKKLVLKAYVLQQIAAIRSGIPHRVALRAFPAKEPTSTRACRRQADAHAEAKAWMDLFKADHAAWLKQHAMLEKGKRVQEDLVAVVNLCRTLAHKHGLSAEFHTILAQCRSAIQVPELW